MVVGLMGVAMGEDDYVPISDPQRGSFSFDTEVSSTTCENVKDHISTGCKDCLSNQGYTTRVQLTYQKDHLSQVKVNLKQRRRNHYGDSYSTHHSRHSQPEDAGRSADDAQRFRDAGSAARDRDRAFAR